MKRERLIEEKKEEIKRIAEKHGAYNVRVLGSVARGEARDDNDVDFLIDAGEKTTSWFPGGLIADLEELLGMRVDIAMSDALYPEIRDEILNEAVPL